jgi:hypothetical protein
MIPATRSLPAVLRAALDQATPLRVLVGTYAAAQPSDLRYANVTINGQILKVPNLNAIPPAPGAVVYLLADDTRLWVLGTIKGA